MLKDLQLNQELLIAKKVGTTVQAWKIEDQVVDTNSRLVAARVDYFRLKHKMTALVGEVDDAYVEGFRIYGTAQDDVKGYAVIETKLPSLFKIEASSLRQRPVKILKGAWM